MANKPPRPTRQLPSIPDANRLITLPKPIIYQILSELNPVHLGDLCKSNSQLAAICREKQFWKFKHTVGFGSPAPKPDQRIVFYNRKQTKLHKDLSNLEDLTREIRINLILSILKNPPSQEVIVGVRNGIPDFDETQFDPSMIQLGADINRLAGHPVLPFDTFKDFEGRILRFIQLAAQPAPQRRGIPVRVTRKPLVGNYLKEQIDPNAKLFEQYPLSDFDNDPIRALLRAIYDNTANYATDLMELEDELRETRRVLDNLRGVKYSEDDYHE